MKLSAQSYTNFRRVIGTLLAFAKRRNYLPKDHDELEWVDKARPGQRRNRNLHPPMSSFGC